MTPTIEVYYDPNRLPPPSVVGWLEALGIAAIYRTPSEAPAEWIERYGCCFPWVVVDGRIVLKAGFQRVHLERWAQHWFGTALVVYWRTPKRASQDCGEPRQQNSGSLAEALTESESPVQLAVPLAVSLTRPLANTKQRVQHWDCDITQLPGQLLAHFRMGWHPIAIWNCDEMTPDDRLVAEALEKLHSNDIVCAQDRDGNVVLLGLRSWYGTLFDDSEAAGVTLAKWVNRAQALKLHMTEIDLPFKREQSQSEAGR